MVIRLVRKADGQPIAGATVRVSHYDYNFTNEGMSTESVRRDESERLTDDKGCCLIEAPSDVSGLVIWFAKDGFAPHSPIIVWKGNIAFAYEPTRGWTHPELREGAVPTITQELHPGEAVGGLVKDAQGRPIEGAEVTAAFGDVLFGPDGDSLTPSNWSNFSDFPYVRVKTDAEGRWRAASLPTDPAELGSKPVLYLRVAHPHYVSDTGAFRRRLSVRTGRAMTGVLVIKPGVSVAGQVRDSQGKSVPGARVALAYSNDPMDFLGTRTDAAGRFVFPHVNDRPALGRWTVTVEATGFAPAWKTSSPYDEPSPLEFSLTPAKPFHGRLIDGHGRPVAGVTVRAELDHCKHLDWHVVTDTDGQFVWPGAPREGDIGLELHKHNYGRRQLKVSAKNDRAHLTFNPE